ncbi:MAG: CcdB family protein [Betaproteobacteria bacterium]
MAQFDVHRNANKEAREEFPYLLEVQADLLSGLRSRVVVPLMRAARIKSPLARLNPTFTVEGSNVLMATPHLAGVPLSALGPRIASLAEKRAEILGAIDILLTGA